MKKIIAAAISLLLFFGAAPLAFAAIAIDNSASDTMTNSGNTYFSYTVGAGADMILEVAFIAGKSGSPTISSVQYASTTMTAVTGSPVQAGTAWQYMYFLVNPPSGAHNVAVQWTVAPDNGTMFVASYSGAAQTGQPDTQTTASGSGTSATLSFTTVTNNDWLVGLFRNNAAGNGTAGANTHLRVTVSGQGDLADTNAAQTPAGSHSMVETFGSNSYGAIGMAIAPYVAPAASHFQLWPLNLF